MQLSVDGRSLQYEVRGRGDDTMIFIPALGTTREMWTTQLLHFEPAYTVALYDSAGHYPSAPSGAGLSLTMLAGDLAALVDTLGVQRPHVVGISMGGMIAQEYAIRFPDRVKSLILVSTTSSYPAESRRQLDQRAETAERDGMAPLVEPTMQRWFTPAFRETHPDTVEWIRQMLWTADPRAYAAAARAVAQVNTTDRLQEITAPVLVLSAEKDSSMPPDSASILARHLRDVRSAEIAEAAHLCSVSHPATFNANVERFLQDSMPRGS